MRYRVCGIGLVGTTTLLGCTILLGCTAAHPDVATVQGHVRLIGGAPLLGGHAAGRVASGAVLVYPHADRTGAPILRSQIKPDGSYLLRIRAGRYFLSTTAATYNGVPARGPSISVSDGQDFTVDVDPSIK